MMLKQPLFLAALFFASVTALAQDPTPAPTPAPAPAPAQKNPTFAVVAIGEELKVMNENAIDALKKEKQAAFEKALASYNKAKKEAEDAGKPFTEKPPVHETVEIKKGGFATEALAKQHLETLMKNKKEGGAEKK